MDHIFFTTEEVFEMAYAHFEHFLSNLQEQAERKMSAKSQPIAQTLFINGYIAAFQDLEEIFRERNIAEVKIDRLN